MALEHSELKFGNYGGGTGGPILCPICGFEFNHDGETQYFGGDDYSAIPGGLRGPATIVPMMCEEGHKWTLCLQFHKGQQFIYAIHGELRRHGQTTVEVPDFLDVQEVS